MKILRAFILADTILLTLLGLGLAFIHPHSFPVVYLEAAPFQEAATLRVVEVGLGALALVLWLSSDLPLVGDRRRLARWLSAANFLIAAMAFIQQTAIWGSVLGWCIVLTFLGLGVGLAWAGLRLLKPDEIAAEIEGLRIPDEIRQGLLQQIGEAAAQEERNRLARDLHDSIKQQLFSINVGAAAAQERWERDPEGARKALADVRRSAREAMVEMQAMLHQLRPEALGTTGLIEALREQCEALEYRSGAEVTLELGEAIPDDRMPPGAPETLFRMAQEMLANVARHARARRVRLGLGRQQDTAVLRVEDDGRGFHPGEESSGMGLRNLRERAAAAKGGLEVASTPGAGTRMLVWMPLVPPPRVEEPKLGRITWALTLGTLLWIPSSLQAAMPTSDGSAQLFTLIGFGFLIPLAAAGSWWLARRTLRRSPGAELPDLARLQYAGHRFRTVLFLGGTGLAIQGAQLAGGWGVFWKLAGALFLALTGLEIFLAHRWSRSSAPSFADQARLLGQQGIGIAGYRMVQILVVLSTALTLVTAVTKLLFRRAPGQIHSLEFVVLAAAVLAYFLWRRPQAQGEPS